MIPRWLASGLFIIGEEQVVAENWNRPHGNGKIDPEQFLPYPKNPIIAKFFREIGRVEELGSGVRNTFKYSNIYVPGSMPKFIEGDIFKAVIPLKKEANQDLNLERLGENEQKILELIAANSQITIFLMAENIGISTTSVENNIKKLKEKDILERIGSARGGHWKIID